MSAGAPDRVDHEPPAEQTDPLRLARSSAARRSLDGLLPAGIGAFCAGLLLQTEGLPDWLRLSLLSLGSLGALAWLALATDLAIGARRAVRLLGGPVLAGRPVVRLCAGLGLVLVSALVLGPEWASVAEASRTVEAPVW